MSTPTTGARLPIGSIRPDPQQPRHLFPPEVTAALEQGQSMPEVIAHLRELAASETWLPAILEELDALADSLATDGQLQPIRVTPQGDGRYLVEEGERRWWAHNLLFYERHDPRFEEIQANLVDDHERNGSVLRRQVAENVMRSAFTAIELAQAYEARLKELRRENASAIQVELEKVVAKENGISDRRVRQYLVLLNLAAPVQTLAQRHRLPERVLRGLLRFKDPEKQLAAVERLIAPKKSRPRPDKTKAANEGASKKAEKPHSQPELHLDRVVSFGRALEAANVKSAARSLSQLVKEDPKKRESLERLHALLQLTLTQ